MKKVCLSLVLVPSLFACESAVKSSEIVAANIPVSQVVGTANRSDYPLTRTIDGDPASYMTTTTLSIGDVKTIAFEFASPSSIARVDLVNNYMNNYHMGDLEILTSQDSTDGSNGTWYSVTSINAGNHGFTDGDGSIDIGQSDVKWVLFRMTYTGTGAHGGTPAFYLSEATFY